MGAQINDFYLNKEAELKVRLRSRDHRGRQNRVDGERLPSPLGGPEIASPRLASMASGAPRSSGTG
jgi:hypothetical protein